MTHDEIIELLSLGETQNIEFKASCRNIDAIGKTICGFLNTNGGYLIIGIEDNGTISGIEDTQNIQRFEEDIIKKLAPKVLVSFEEQIVNDKKVWIVEVPQGADLPYSYDNNVFVRYAETTRQADIETIKDMILRRQIEPERWERRFSDADITKDLDENEIKATIRSDKHDKILTYSRGDTPIEMLEYLGFIKYGRLTCGGDLLFCINPAKRFPQARVKAVCYKSDKIDNDYIDMKSFEGPIIHNLERVFSFILRNIPNQMKFSSNSLTREEKPIYPPEAIREGLVNAFAHRDYADFRGSILVQIFADRLEIHNSGRFLDGITSDTIAKGQISLLRNPDIAHTLYTRKYMEKLGRGGMLIRKACQEYGLVEPKWSEDTNGVTLTFFANTEVTEEVSEEVTAEVSKEVKKLLILLEPNKEYTKKELQEKLGLKHDEYFRKSYMLPLLDMKILEMTIPDKPKSSKQKYRLTKKGFEIKNTLMNLEQL